MWRIRINAIPVLRIVSEITDFDWPEQSVVLLYPFKLLMNRETAIREAMRKLELIRDADGKAVPLGGFHSEPSTQSAKDTQHSVLKTVNETQKTQAAGGARNIIERSPTFNSMSTSKRVEYELLDQESQVDSKESAVDSSKPIDKPEQEEMSNSLGALRDLHCLIRFMDEELTPVLRNLKDPSNSRIYFRDLWHLFKPGDDIFIPRLSSGGEERVTDSDSAMGAAHRQNAGYQEDLRILDVTVAGTTSLKVTTTIRSFQSTKSTRSGYMPITSTSMAKTSCPLPIYSGSNRMRTSAKAPRLNSTQQDF